MIVRIAVVRNQSEISLQAIAGEYVVEWNGGCSRLQAGSERRYTLPAPVVTPWTKRVRMQRSEFEGGFRTGVHGTTDGDTFSSHRWLQLEPVSQPQSMDPLYTQACAIAFSESEQGQLNFRDERPKQDQTILDGWTPLHGPIVLKPVHEDARIALQGVRVGIGFHWDHHRTLSYRGPLTIYLLNDGLCAVVDEPIEDYLASVNSSEMPSDMHLEFLKAQTVAARSWLLANLGTHHPGAPFDVCSDDHCQCYHGIEQVKPLSRRASDETRGQILVAVTDANEKRITDARYAKTCGGRVEPGDLVWRGETPGLLYCHDGCEPASNEAITNETTATSVLSDTGIDDFCNPVLHKYPPSLEYCAPYYRWVEKVPQKTICTRIYRSTGYDLGMITRIDVIHRGPSGRIHELEVTGQTGNVRVTGELAIRRAFSETHLPSSAFVAEISETEVVLIGAGWGHGAGLCQTGAAVRAGLGQDYKTILKAYYPSSTLERIVTIER